VKVVVLPRPSVVANSCPEEYSKVVVDADEVPYPVVREVSAAET
jgi:hypothetical protein